MKLLIALIITVIFSWWAGDTFGPAGVLLSTMFGIIAGAIAAHLE